jgi:hypothetical protein
MVQVQGSTLKNVVHQDGEETRKLRDVAVLEEDDWSFTFQRPGGQVVRIAKKFVVRIEDAGGRI